MSPAPEIRPDDRATARREAATSAIRGRLWAADQGRPRQRTRLIEAATELAAERGYADLVVAEIVSRAAVSKSTFYALYEAKADCIFDAHKHCSATLLAAIDSACEPALAPDSLRAAIRAVLSFAAEHPAAAELLATGVLAPGPSGRARYLATLGAVSRRLAKADPALSPPSASALAAALLSAPTIAAAVEVAPTGGVLSLEDEFLELASHFTRSS